MTAYRRSRSGQRCTSKADILASAKDLLDTAEASTYLDGIWSAKTLCNWRSAGIGPRYVKARGLVLYRRAALDQFIEAAEVTPNAA